MDRPISVSVYVRTVCHVAFLRGFGVCMCGYVAGWLVASNNGPMSEARHYLACVGWMGVFTVRAIVFTSYANAAPDVERGLSKRGTRRASSSFSLIRFGSVQFRSIPSRHSTPVTNQPYGGRSGEGGGYPSSFFPIRIPVYPSQRVLALREQSGTKSASRSFKPPLLLLLSIHLSLLCSGLPPPEAMV